MMNRFKSGIFLLTLLFLFGAPLQNVFSQGQGDLSLALVEVNLLPEFRRPSMLVIYDIQLEADTSLPQELVFQIPSDAELEIISGRNAGGQRVMMDWQVVEIGDWKDIKFTTHSLEIVLEYEDPNLIKQEDLRQFEYQWLSIYPVMNLSIIVRQSFGASQIESDPSLGQRMEGLGETFYYQADIGTIPAGELFVLDISYTKDTANLSYPALKVQPAMPIDENSPGRTPPPMSVALWLLAVAFAVLIMVGLYYWWFRANVSSRGERVAQGVGITNPEKQAVFCHECGMRSKTGDSYCRNCGTELRQPTDIEKALYH